MLSVVMMNTQKQGETLVYGNKILVNGGKAYCDNNYFTSAENT